MVSFTWWKVITRRKILSSDPETDGRFNRVLRTFDLTALGVGATLGVGVYVLAGHVAKDQAGPSVILSFAIAALASLFAGLCYAEFGARVPKAGSAYIYSYVCIGEFAAFIIGWNLILEYIIGSASVSRGISLYLDTLINGTLKTTFMEIAPIHWDFMAPYFDFFALSIAFVIGVSLAFGVTASTVINNTFTIVNLAIVIFVITAGSVKADFHNWQINPEEVTGPHIVGKGGFFPFGIEGTLKGAATCFFGYVGFDCIATTGEEVRDPRRAIPRSILFSLLIIFLSYFGVSTVLTLMWPYYLQDVDAPLPFVFQEMNWPIAKWIVTVGGMIGLFASLFGAMFPLPRIIYAMSQDRLIFRHLGNINPKFNTPIAGNIWAAILTGLMAALFDLTQLVNMLSIGTLLAYTIVAISITLLRYMHNTHLSQELEMNITETTELNGRRSRATFRTIILQLINFKRLHQPNSLSTKIVGTLLCLYCLFCLGFSLSFKYGYDEIMGNFESWSPPLLIVFLILLIICLIIISMQPRESINGTFRVPLVPLIPGISIFVNIYLMLQLDVYTWIRFSIWMAIGIPIYLICMCMYNRTNEIKGHYFIKSHQNSFYNGKIKMYDGENDFTVSSSSSSISPKIINSSVQKGDHHQKSLESIGISSSSISTTTTKINASEEENSEGTNNRSKILPLSQQQQQQQQTSSFDEIISADKIVNSLKEMKNSNGKTFFIEDNNNNNNHGNNRNNENNQIDNNNKISTIIDTSNNNNNNNNDITIDQDVNGEEVEKSVIAMLDNVLQDEDALIDYSNFNRKTSIDSEMIPSFVETSTVAMVHNSYNSLKEEENYYENDKIIENEINKTDQKYDENLGNEYNNNNNNNVNIEKEKDNIENNEGDNNNNNNNDNKNQINNKENIEMKNNSTNHSNKNEVELNENYLNNESKNMKDNKTNLENTIITMPTTPDIIAPIVQKQYYRRRSSSASEKSFEENAIRSKAFKDKLSKLLAHVPLVGGMTTKQQKSPEAINTMITTTTTTTTTIPVPGAAEASDTSERQSYPSPTKMKTSKSESDISQLHHIENRQITENSNNELHENSNNNNSNNSNNSSIIPKAPKFDPILYKTVGTRQHNQAKERPKLDIFLPNNNNNDDDDDDDNDDDSKQKSTEKESTECQEVNSPSPVVEFTSPKSFKKRLENLLKRGPSYKTMKPLQKIINNPRKQSDRISSSSSDDDDNDVGNKVTISPIIETNIDLKQTINNSNNDNRYKDQFSNVLKAITNRKNSIDENEQNDVKESLVNNYHPPPPPPPLPPSIINKNRPKTIEEALKNLRHINVVE